MCRNTGPRFGLARVIVQFCADKQLRLVFHQLSVEKDSIPYNYVLAIYKYVITTYVPRYSRMGFPDVVCLKLQADI